MKDVTGTTPVQRMTVARGVLKGASTPLDVGRAEAAAFVGVKQSHLLVPDAHAVQPTNVLVDVAEDNGVVVTVTVQALARADLETAALCGVTAALLSLREQGGGQLSDVHVVQSVA